MPNESHLRRCPVYRCDAMIKRSLCCCRLHWQMVPQKQRNLQNAAYREYCEARHDRRASDGRVMLAIATLRSTTEDTIAMVNAALGAPPRQESAA